MWTIRYATVLAVCTLIACGDDGDERGDAFGTPTTPTLPPAPSDPIDPEDTATGAPTTGDLPSAACGDGVVDPGEACDDGPDNGTYGACDATCSGPGLRCGDGRVDGLETCDDGNLDDGDACTSLCIVAACGDGYVQPPEACDDGRDGDPDDGCTDTCTLPACGDGLLQLTLAETCDDGNLDAEDGCEDDCTPTTKTMFVTSTKVSGNFGGVLKADEVCRAAAAFAGLPGDYLAWLGDGVLHPATRLVASDADYVLVDGTVVANGFLDLIDSVLDHAINLDEFGVPVDESQLVWTGTKADGFSSTVHCKAWSGCDNQFSCIGGAGAAWDTTSDWTAATFPCNYALPLYCVEQ